MLRNSIYSIISLSLFSSVIFFSQISLTQATSFSEIVINGQIVENVERSKWFKEVSNIEIKGMDGETKIELKVDPGEGLVKVSSSDNFPVRVLVDNSLYGKPDIQLPNKIKKYRIELKMDGASVKKFAVLEARLGNPFKLVPIDLLIVPLVYKLVITAPFRWLYPKRCTIKISRQSN